MSARFAAIATIETLERRQLFAAGDLDPTFGTGGSIPYSAIDPAITLLTPLAGGKFLGIGPEGAFRRNADATLDSTFHSGPTLDHISDVQVLSDGKILISGSDDQ